VLDGDLVLRWDGSPSLARGRFRSGGPPDTIEVADVATIVDTRRSPRSTTEPSKGAAHRDRARPARPSSPTRTTTASRGASGAS
jgi:hypothetical protein